MKKCLMAAILAFIVCEKKPAEPSYPYGSGL